MQVTLILPFAIGDLTQMNANNLEYLLIGKSLREISEISQKDYHSLDEPLPGQLDSKLVIGHEKSAVGKAYPSDIRLAQPPKILDVFKLILILYDMLRALWLIGSADERTCIFINGGHRFGMLTYILNSLVPIFKRKIVLWEAYIPIGKVA